ncbi:FoF1 ATP synthase subunit delta/epsilon [Candidatus Weimeria sp. HCP3S3_B5]|uniref:FoF1 ATP synthase subunit delta/epsilon n=1 Tax=Candidatus Weimeria sp. HCP3S3_B5 TaxID=3438871 RepID=UPI002A95160E|nr:F0F1 ATP synthase subunit epsilon [Lachnospiraceae bacterium]MDY6352315.1 F0F1 ATP synthase subunit epsilon [Lachnospiraceae bacterium]
MFYLKVIAADKTFYAGFADSVNFQSHDGREQILSHHENMVIALNEGEIEITPALNAGNGADISKGQVITGLAGIGFAEVINNRVTIIVESCERPEEIDVRRAREAEERAREKLRQKQSIQEYYHSRASLARAMARLAAAKKKGEG